MKIKDLSKKIATFIGVITIIYGIFSYIFHRKRRKIQPRCYTDKGVRCITKKTNPHAGIYYFVGNKEFYVGKSVNVFTLKKLHIEGRADMLIEDFPRKRFLSQEYKWRWIRLWDLIPNNLIDVNELKKVLIKYEKYYQNVLKERFPDKKLLKY